MKCRACLSTNILELISFGKQYLSDFRADDVLPPMYPIDLVICQVCKLVQLKQSTPPSQMYHDNYGFRSGINESIKADLKDVAQKAQAYFKSGMIIDIGANDGTLLSFFEGMYFKVGFDPVKKFSTYLSQKANYHFSDYFNAKVFREKFPNQKAQIITAISMFYDLEDPNKFLSDILELLAANGIVIIQQNYLASMLRLNAYDNICHEHLEYYTLLSLENLLSRHGLEVFDVEELPVNGGSFRAYIARKGQRNITSNVNMMRLYEQSRQLGTPQPYYEFADRVRSQSFALKSFVTEQVRSGKSVYAYGASTRGNTLLQYSCLNADLIKKAVEKNVEKVGKKISSLQIPIISEEQMRLDKPEYLLILPWFFVDEFIEREKEYLEQGGKFIIPLPGFNVYEGSSNRT